MVVHSHASSQSKAKLFYLHKCLLLTIRSFQQVTKTVDHGQRNTIWIFHFCSKVFTPRGSYDFQSSQIWVNELIWFLIGYSFSCNEVWHSSSTLLLKGFLPLNLLYRSKRVPTMSIWKQLHLCSAPAQWPLLQQRHRHLRDGGGRCLQRVHPPSLYNWSTRNIPSQKTPVALLGHDLNLDELWFCSTNIKGVQIKMHSLWIQSIIFEVKELILEEKVIKRTLKLGFILDWQALRL